MPNVVLGDEAQLMQRIRQRDEHALQTLYDKCSRPVYSLALRVLGNADMAEEVVQDVLLKVWEAPEKWEPDRGALMSWLLTVTRYAAIDRLRQEQRRATTEPLEDHAGKLGQNENYADTLALSGALGQLPEEQRAVIQLAYYQGLTHQDIAETTGIPLGTVKTRLRLGMQKLRALWQDTEQNAKSTPSDGD